MDNKPEREIRRFEAFASSDFDHDVIMVPAGVADAVEAIALAELEHLASRAERISHGARHTRAISEREDPR